MCDVCFARDVGDVHSCYIGWASTLYIGFSAGIALGGLFVVEEDFV
jgi:hypothetical protein